MISFKSFLKSKPLTDNFSGNVLKDLREDEAFPATSTWSVIRDYLLNKKFVSLNTLEAARQFWLDYQRTISARLSREALIVENTRLKETVTQLRGELAQKNAYIGTVSDPAGNRPQVQGEVSALLAAYLQYKIVEFLQPHTGYEFDDGFQPCSIIGCAIECDQKAQKLLAGAGETALNEVLAAMIENGSVILTPYEPANGDCMLGLPENLGKRKAAFEERKNMIIESATRVSLTAKWNEDGTGWLETPGGLIVEPAGSVWDLLSCLNNAEADETKRPERLN